MASKVTPPPHLVGLFTDIALLPDLFARGGPDWAAFLSGQGANLDHVEDDEVPPGDIYEHMRRDVLQFARRIELLGDRKTPTREAVISTTPTGDVIRRIGRKPRESRGEEDDRLLTETLSAQIDKHYKGDNGVSLTHILQDGARRVARVSGNWAGYCPGLLLGEARRLIGAASADSKEAQRLVGELVRTRIRVADEAGIRAPDPGRTRMQNVIDYADAINIHHKHAIEAPEEEKEEGYPLVSITAARSTTILLTYVGLLVHLDTLGPVNCLGPPDSPVAILPSSPLDPVPVTLPDGSVWDLGMEAGYVALLMMYLMNHEFTANEALVFPSLALDMKSRVIADNVPDIDRRKIKEHRKINKALTMEMLSAMLLARLDSPREVLSHCKTRHGLPHRPAGSGLIDVEAVYEAPGTTPGFQVIVAASAKRDVSDGFYTKQLVQAHTHGVVTHSRTGIPVYALVLNGGKIGSSKRIQRTYRTFVESMGLRQDGPVRIVPVYAPDLAVAVRRLEASLAPDAFRFASDVLPRVFDALIAGAFITPKEDRDPDWACNTWTQMVPDPYSSAGQTRSMDLKY